MRVCNSVHDFAAGLATCVVMAVVVTATPSNASAQSGATSAMAPSGQTGGPRATARLVAAPTAIRHSAVRHCPSEAEPPGTCVPVRGGASLELSGLVVDSKGEPLSGVAVSVLGAASGYVVTDKEGRFAIRNLAPGPYVVRAHLMGYVPLRSRLVRLGEPQPPLAITLVRREGPASEAPVLAAGVGPVQEPAVEPAADPGANDHDHEEVAWRLRHTKRSVLKEAVARVGLGDSSGEVLAGSGRAVAGAARLAASLVPDMDLNGQVHLLTSASFDRPQDLFSAQGRMPRGLAYLALAAPGDGGEWLMKGTLTQGDVSSWIVSGSYTRNPLAAHAYEAGASYAMQRYLGGNAQALAALRDGSRNVGTLYGFDSWRVAAGVRVNYGAQYAHYDYLGDEQLFSPRVGVELQPVSSAPLLRVHVNASRVETAPGAAEFVTPALGVWLPPERTFSPVSTGPLVPQRVDQVEAGLEHTIGVVSVSARAFRQVTSNQVVGVFGVSPTARAEQTGHYYVGSIGGFAASGWSAGAAARLGAHTRASVDVQRAAADWGRALDPDLLLVSVPDGVFRRVDRVQTVSATLESQVPSSETRVLVVYRLSRATAPTGESFATGGAGRFDVQVNQALPFRAFTQARWEALVAVRSVAYEAAPGASVYDELLVLRPPTRVLGGVTVRF
jgi:hypothetical protein